MLPESYPPRGDRAQGDTVTQTKTGYLDADAKRRLVNRISRAAGHLNAIKKMIEEERCADDVLIQLSAARSAVGQISARILEEHQPQPLPDDVAARVRAIVRRAEETFG